MKKERSITNLREKVRALSIVDEGLSLNEGQRKKEIVLMEA